MNITGAQLYSKATRGLRQADVITDQHFKLVFIYPMLFDSKLQGKYQDIMRQFISVSMLKEIFVSNTLHMISIASKGQSIEDENGDRTDVYSLIGKTVAGRFGSQGGNLDFRIPPQPTNNKYELQQKIKEKTAIIRKLIASDPRLKVLNPYIEVVTLDNMIDVPVIVGTKPYSINSITLAFILAGSISLKKPLNTWANVQTIFNVIENTNEEDAWQLFTNLVDNEKKSSSERLIAWVGEDNPKLAAVMQSISRGVKRAVTGNWLSRNIGKKAAQSAEFGRDYIKPIVPGLGRGDRDPQEDPDLPFKTGKEFDILKVLKTDLDDAKLYFKFMLDDNLLRTQFGLDKNPGQMSTAVKKISSQGESLFFQMHQNFIELIGYNANVAINSFFNTIYPWDSDVDYLEVKNKYLDQKLNNVVSDLNEELKSLLASTFSSESVDTTRAKNMKKLCTAGLEQTTGMIQGRTSELTTVKIGAPNFTSDDLTRFLKVLEDTSSEYSSTLEKLKHQLSSVINNSRSYFDKVDVKVDDTVDEMMNVYINKLTRDESGSFDNISLKRNQILTPANDPDGTKTVTYINQGKSYLTTIILTMYYTSVVDAVCQYVKYLDVEIETVKNDVLDLPNYTLVLPVEVVMMLHSAIMSQTWRNLVSKNQTQSTNLTDNYVKGVVRFISKKIDVPNLIVIDSKRDQVFYKLMYTSQINKSNIGTFKTFVQSVQKTALESGTNY